MSPWKWLPALVLAASTISACAGEEADPTVTPPRSPTSTSFPTTVSTGEAPDPLVDEYRPGREANLFLPQTEGNAPLVVMVPGGGWRTANPTGLADLARALAQAGMIAVTVEVGAYEDGVTYPAPLEDIHCALAYAATRAEEAGLRPSRTVLVGHSSGAHLAALAALSHETEAKACSHPPIAADALVGLAGVYDVSRLPALAFLLFGVTPEEDPDLWERGNPLQHADRRPQLPALLLHGSADPLVPTSFTEAFAAALEAGGHDTTKHVVEGADHLEILRPEFSAEHIIEWIERLTGRA